MAVASGPRETGVQNAITNEVGTVSTTIRRADLQRDSVSPRNPEDAFDLRGCSDGGVVEATNHCTLAQRRICKARGFKRRVGGDECIDTEDALERRTVTPRECHRAF